MSALTRAAETDEQEHVLGQAEGWLKACGVTPYFGTTVGKSPQSVIADIKSQGGEFRACFDNDDGRAYLSVSGEETPTKYDFLRALKEKGVEGVTDAHVEAAQAHNESVDGYGT